ncbi:InlB B-repeat-containing protein [Paucisalibacillus globulus]|uniref:InlB B-repeat-containing protein n=1 Tax=Paucisalibacillus globulus TaxID=351095 RepID=UPI0004191C90|nr:Ig-like domain-containing protein [Paucisalibacillus globulus]
MKEQIKIRLNRLMSIFLVFMLLSYYVPIGLLVATAEGAEEDIFTLQIVDNGEPVEGALVKGTNGVINVNGTTDSSGIVQFEEVTIEELQEKYTFNFDVELQDGEKKEFSLEVKNGFSDPYVFDLATIPTEPVEPEKHKVTVNVTNPDLGKVKINNENYENPLQIEDGEEVEIEVTPDSDAKIKSLKINNEDIEIEDENFTKTIQINKETEIDVEFTKVYTIKFSSNKNGDIEGDGYQEINAMEGQIIASQGSTPSFTATPEVGYHLSEITIDNTAIDLSSLKNGDSYKHVFEPITENHTVSITFAINTYEINTSVTGENGIISQSTEVEHNGSTIITIIPEDDYQIKSLTDNDKPVKSEVQQDGGSFMYVLNDITENHNINVEFKEVPNSEKTWEELISIKPTEGKAVDLNTEENILIYSNDAKVKIKILDGWPWFGINDHWRKTDFTINKNTTIERIRYGIIWDQKIARLNPTLKILFDTKKPEINEVVFEGDDKVKIKGTDWYSGGVIKGSIDNVEDKHEGTPYSTEIDSVYYQKEGSSEKVKIETYNKEDDTFEFTLPEEDYSGDYKIWAVDKAGNASDVETVKVNIDHSSPTIKGIYIESADNREDIDDEEILEEYVELTEYGYFFKKPLEVTVVAVDEFLGGGSGTGVESMVVYLKDHAKDEYYAVLEDGKLKQIDETMIDTIEPIETDRELTFNIPHSFKGQIIAKATDKVKNTGPFESPKGAILETPDQHKLEEHVAFEKDDAPYTDSNGGGLYADNLDVELTVTDTYSGIETIEWSVVAPNDTENNQYGSLTVNHDGEITDGSDENWEKTQTSENLVTEMKKMITVNHNSNDIVVNVKMTDRSGNMSEEQIKFSIDKTSPNLEVEFDNNSPDEENGNIYSEKRIATITITERNFNPDNVLLHITKDNKEHPVVVEWTTIQPEEGKHSDLTTHTTNIVFEEDGEYTFDVSYMDNAENPGPDVEKHEFIIDRTAPEVKVSYDNKDAANEKYYKQKRTATITVEEHNFDPKRVKINGSTTIIGKGEKDFPALSAWVETEEGVYEATIDFEEDALYQYNIVVSDKAGNTFDDFEDEFYMDQTEAVLIDGEAVTFEQVNDNNFAKVLNFLTFGTFFNKEVHIKVQTLDETSGIEDIVLKTIDGQIIDQDDITINQDELTGEAVFILDVDRFDAAFEVDVKDLAHNIGTYPVTEENSNIVSDNSNIVVEKDKPKVSIDVIPNEGVKQYKYQYNGDVTFSIIAEDKGSGINTVVIDVNGKKYEYDYSDLEEMQIKPDAYRISTNHKDIVGNEDGSYIVSVHVVDNAGNENEAETKIYIDKTNPIITKYEFSVKGKKVDETDKFKKSLELTEYGYYFKEPTQVKISGEDPKVDHEFTSNLKSITVYLRDHENGKYYAALKNGSLKEIKESEIVSITPITTKDSVTVNVPKAFKGQIFAQATDYVQNTGPYIAPNGMVVENEAQHKKETHIKLKRADAPFKDTNGGDLYANNVNVELTVTDTYSGIEEIEWSVVAPYDMANNQGGKLKLNNDKTYTEDSNAQGWKQTRSQLNLVTEMKKTLTVNHNSNNIKVKVKMTDRAGHTSEEEITFSIDKTSPSINVSYDNNSPDPEHQDYYKENRTATITITERNFKPEDVVYVVTNTDNIIPVINGWSSNRNSNNPDLTTHTATITYSADGDYTFDIQYKDNAGNKAAPVAQDSFTIDKTKPIINVSYNTNDALNENFFNTARTATISVTEHNFDPSRIEITGTAFHDGEVVDFPSLSGWTRNGDVHTASIVYNTDALYSFDIDFTDMAGNITDDFSPQEFHIDQTEPTLTITGVEDMSANNGKVAPIIRYSDTNFDQNSVKIELTGSNRGEVELEGKYSERNNGQVFIFDDFGKTKENDDLYTLTASLVDLAGNEITEEVRFSVNRFGSVYTFDDSLDALIGKYVQSEQDIIITETNVNSLNKDSIMLKMTHNGSPTDLVAGEDFTVNETGGEDKWSQYTYKIHKDLFVGDGRYTIALYSEDAAGNTNENIDEAKKAEISFGIDKTNPVIVPIDIEDGEQYAVDSKKATISVKDNLVLDHVKINLNNEEINFEEDGENYTFIIPNANSTQEVSIQATDAAGNELTAEVKDFLVTTNLLVRWYNNKPLFIGSLGGVGVVGVALAAFFLYRKKDNGVSEEVELEDKVG